MDLFADLPEPSNEKSSNSDAATENNSEKTDADASAKRKIDLVDQEQFVKRQRLESEYELQGYYAERKGEREEMQDAHVIIDDFISQILRIKQESNIEAKMSEEITNMSYFAVFDGHGGCRASRYAAKNLHTKLAQLLPLESLNKLESEIKRCFIEAFKKTDEDFLKIAAANKPSWKDGTTAIVVLLMNNTLYIANLGDSKAILCRQQSKESSEDSEPAAVYRGIPLSHDHCPTNYDERQRIQKAGGSVKDGRVLGVLEVSRSIGDGQFKKHGVICLPDVKRCQLTRQDKYIVIACDGLWKSFTTDEAIDYINQTLEQNKDMSRGESMEEACSKICVDAVKKCSGDNVTVLMVDIKRGGGK